MKKILSLTLVLTTLLSLVSCGKQGEEIENAGTEVEIEETLAPTEEPLNETVVDPTKKPEATKKPSKTEAPALEQKPNQPVATNTPTQAPTQKPTEAPAPKTMGETLLLAFKQEIAKNPNATAASLAKKILSHEIIKFKGDTIDVVPGNLSGFDAEITGFKTATMFAPLMGSIAFVGYVFELEDASKTSTFVSTLKKNANPRWNICVEAGETVVQASGNKVFFLMCPSPEDLAEPDGE